MTKSERILTAVQNLDDYRQAACVVTAKDGKYGATLAILGTRGDRIVGRVKHANLGASVAVGDVLAVPVDRVQTWTA